MATERLTGIHQYKPGELIINGKKHKAIIYPLEDKEVELYRVGALADALEKTSQLIVKWEKEKLFPKPLYRVTGSGFGNCKRLYSKEQITNIRKVWKAFPFGKGSYKHKTIFFKTIHAVFYKTHVIDGINIITKPKVEAHGKPTEQNSNVQRPSARESTTAESGSTGKATGDFGK